MFISDKRITRSVEDNLWDQIQDFNQYPWYYIVVTYNKWQEYFDKEKYDYRSPQQVRKTHRLLRRMLKEAFKVNAVHSFMERHVGTQDHFYDALIVPQKVGNYLSPEMQLDEIKENGRFHTNILMSKIDDHVIQEPNSKCRRLFERQSALQIPIYLTQYNIEGQEGIESLKIDLVNACCRQLDWVCDNQKDAVNTQVFYDASDVKTRLHYCLKDCYNKGVDFNQVIDFSNSDFHKLL